ncbi:MAG: AraC family transcriptional regulator [Lachnospiraceae bacterium]|nr:AraC family transcriptional regulator [Lachnospiraceae bacterium]
MNYLYEYSDILNTPYESFVFDTAVNDFPVRPHFHPYVEILCMTEGNMFVTAGEEEYYLEEGDMILFFSNVLHSMSASSMRSARFAGIKFDISRLAVNTNYTPGLRTLLAVARKQNARVFFPGGDEIHEHGSFFEFCREELDRKEIGFDVAVHAKLCLLMTKLIRLWQDEGIDFNNVSDFITREELSLQNITEYIDLHLDEDLRVDDLAKRCNMSYSHFARSFKEMYGRSCKEHLESLRVEKAEEMLKFTDRSLNDIGQELGYADQSHFIRMFRKYKGVTPGAVRKTAV